MARLHRETPAGLDGSLTASERGGRDGARPVDGGSDVGRDLERDLGDEPPASHPRQRARTTSRRSTTSAPVSGHIAGARVERRRRPTRPSTTGRAPATSSIRPSGRSGRRASRSRTIDRDALAAHATQSHAQPLLDEGPAGLPVVYTIDAGAFDIVVNGDHLLSWGIEPPSSRTRRCATSRAGRRPRRGPTRSPASGASSAPTPATAGTPPGSCCPRSSTTSSRSSGAAGRILIGLPERHLLTAGSLRPDDDDFATLFADFIVEQSGGADEPIDRRVFELVDGRLVEFAGSTRPMAVIRGRRPRSASRSPTRSRRSRSTGPRRSTR